MGTVKAPGGKIGGCVEDDELGTEDPEEEDVGSGACERREWLEAPEVLEPCITTEAVLPVEDVAGAGGARRLASFL